MPRRSQIPDDTPRYAPEELDVNRVVSYNLRIAREQNGWTQEQFADRLEQVTGHRPTQASVSALERAWEGGRRREFDAQELVDFAVALNVPVVWFFLPPPGDRREIKNTGRRLFALIELLIGRAEQLPRIEERLRQLGLRDNTADEEISRMLTGGPDVMTPQAIREFREGMLAMILDEMASELDKSAAQWGSFFDRVRQVTIRGVIASLTNDVEFLDRLRDLPEHTADVTSTVDVDVVDTGGDNPEHNGPTGDDTGDDTATGAAAAQPA